MAAAGITVLGVDPGLGATGYGVVTMTGRAAAGIEHGCIRPSRRLALADRLLTIYEAMYELVRRHQPAAMAIEDPFIGENARSALALGRAQAVVMLAAASGGVPVLTYSPATVKDAVTGYGRSDKQQVAEMVRMQLGMTHAPEPLDAADALAVALCHLAHAARPALRELT
ncbi:MAG TPA: crossover junction endodeoxyribonuclease RuvC [Dehalococcoidia bacterium]|nr:crossover junction endodeoxyribonuclease RuvC [Dehalococcoidia bacterium]